MKATYLTSLTAEKGKGSKHGKKLDDVMAAVSAGQLTYEKADGKKIAAIMPTGPMLRCFID